MSSAITDVPRDQLEACAREYMTLVEDIERTVDSGLDDGLKLRVLSQLLRDFRA